MIFKTIVLSVVALSALVGLFYVIWFLHDQDGEDDD